MELTRRDFRVIMHYDYCNKIKAAECHRRICAAYGDGIVAIKTVETWFRKFKNGDMSIKDEPIPGRPLEVSDSDLLTVITEDRFLTTRELGAMFDCSHTTIQNSLKRLNLTFKYNRWVPHQLSPQNKLDRVRACQNLLRDHEICSSFDRMITCDEKWCYYDNTARKGGYSEPGVSVGDVTKRGLTNKKTLLCIWWDRRGIIYKRYLKSGETIDGELYSQMLVEVQQNLMEKRRIVAVRKNPLFHQDNARPYTCARTRQQLRDLGWYLMTHPPYSPDIAPSDYYLFKHLQAYLKDAIFNSAEAAQKEVDNFLESRSPEFWAKGIDQLPKRWQKIIELNGEYHP